DSLRSCLARIRHPTRSTLFPYTTLFRSMGMPPIRDIRPAKSPDRKPMGSATRVDGRPGLHRNRGTGPPPRLGSSAAGQDAHRPRSEEHTSELQSRSDLVCRLLLEKKKTQ